MKLTQLNPVYVRIDEISDNEESDLRDTLTFKDLGAQYDYVKAKNSKWGYREDPFWQDHVNKLKDKVIQCALLEDKKGLYTYAGLLDFLKRENFKFSFENKIVYPSYKSLPYTHNYKPYTPHSHQSQAVTELLNYKQAAIRLPTGSGKTFVVEMLIRKTGFSTVITVPSISIAKQFYDQLCNAFGKKYVGLYGDGKKEFKKHIVIGISASLYRLKEGDPAFEYISKKDMFVVDEAHLIGAPTVASIALGLAQNIPYRYSVSATPERTDGKDIFLEGIIGKVVYEKQFKELVKEGILADLHFFIFNVESDSLYDSENAKRNSQEHFLYNKEILSLAARMANLKVEKFDEPTIILIEEKEQLSYLRPYLKVGYDFAHSGSDVSKQVKDFNAGKIKLLIGTSAIATGTDTKVVKNLILLFSGKSVIKFKQAIGRATRIAPGKIFCNVIDFHVTNHTQSSRHFQERLRIYESVSDHINFREAF